MKKTLVRFLCLTLALLMLVPGFVSCNGGDTEETTTTTTKDEENKNPNDTGEVFSSNPYAQAGLELMLKSIKDYYNPRTNWLRVSVEDSNACPR